MPAQALRKAGAMKPIQFGSLGQCGRGKPMSARFSRRKTLHFSAMPAEPLDIRRAALRRSRNFIRRRRRSGALRNEPDLFKNHEAMITPGFWASEFMLRVSGFPAPIKAVALKCYVPVLESAGSLTEPRRVPVGGLTTPR